MALDDDTLQRYFDGDLTPVEEVRVRAEVERSPTAQARLKELAQLSELLRSTLHEAGAGLDADALFAGIQSDIRKQTALGFGERLRLMSSEWIEHRKAVLVPTVASLAVAAAALVVLMVPRETSDPVAQTVPGVSAPAVKGTRIENVDFGESTGTVFEVESQGVGAAVVWIADDEVTE